MAYNKAREEKKWHLWKDNEERQLRQLGVSEGAIKRLRDADWEDFKAERRFFEHSIATETYLDRQAAEEFSPYIQTVQDLLDEIDNENLFKFLASADKLTLQIVIWKMEEYTSAEISAKSGLSINAIDLRIWHFKRKLKNIL